MALIGAVPRLKTLKLTSDGSELGAILAALPSSRRALEFACSETEHSEHDSVLLDISRWLHKVQCLRSLDIGEEPENSSSASPSDDEDAFLRPLRHISQTCERRDVKLASRPWTAGLLAAPERIDSGSASG